MSQKEKNQRDRADEILHHIHSPVHTDLEKLREIIGSAQNHPPLGIADGSITESQWSILANIYSHGMALSRFLNAWEATAKGLRHPPESA